MSIGTVQKLDSDVFSLWLLSMTNVPSFFSLYIFPQCNLSLKAYLELSLLINWSAAAVAVKRKKSNQRLKWLTFISFHSLKVYFQIESPQTFCFLLLHAHTHTYFSRNNLLICQRSSQSCSASSSPTSNPYGDGDEKDDDDHLNIWGPARFFTNSLLQQLSD